MRKAFKGASRPDTRELMASAAPAGDAASAPPLQIDINLADKNGTTALMVACKRDFVDLARLLVDKGARTVLANKKGERAAALVSKSNEELKSYLQELEADEEAQAKEQAIRDATEQLRAAIVVGDLAALEKAVATVPYPEETWRRKVPGVPSTTGKGEVLMTLHELLVAGGREDVLMAFVRGGGDVLLPGPRGRTLLHQVRLLPRLEMLSVGL